MFFPRSTALMTAYWKQDCRGGRSLSFSLFDKILGHQPIACFYSPWYSIIIIHIFPSNDRGGGQGGRGRSFVDEWQGWLWTFTGSSQECVWSHEARRGGAQDRTEGCGYTNSLLFIGRPAVMSDQQHLHQENAVLTGTSSRLVAYQSGCDSSPERTPHSNQVTCHTSRS